MRPCTIGSVARRAGVGVETVRFYERQGLITQPPRGASSYRHYPEETVARLRFIQRAKALGFSLRDIRELLSLRVDLTGHSREVKARAQAKIADIEEKIRRSCRSKRPLPGSLLPVTDVPLCRPAPFWRRSKRMSQTWSF